MSDETKPEQVLQAMLDSANANKLDEMEEGLRVIAKCYFAFYSGLVESGFTEEQAFAMTQAFQVLQSGKGR